MIASQISDSCGLAKLARSSFDDGMNRLLPQPDQRKIQVLDVLLAPKGGRIRSAVGFRYDKDATGFVAFYWTQRA